MQSLNKLNTPEQKLEAIIKKHAELVSGWRRKHTLVLCVFVKLWFIDVFLAVGGASEWSEAAEGSAEEAAASDEGEGPAAERAQPRRAGSQQTGGALPRAAEAQQDLKGTSAPLMSALHAVVEARFLIWDTEVDICCWFFWRRVL